MSNTNAAILAWLSREKDKAETTGENLDQQESKCKDVITKEGWNLVHVCRGVESRTDEGLDKVPDEFRKLLDMVEAGEVDVIVARDMDRFGRSKTLDLMWTLANPDIYLYMEDGARRPYVKDDEWLSDIQSGMARAEGKKIKKRLRQAAERNAKAGKAQNGRRAFGYESDGVTINPKEARLLKDAAKRVINGESARSIARDWNAKGVRTPGTKKNPDGNEWKGNNLLRILSGPRVNGKRQHKGVEYDAQWPEIIDDRTRELIQRRQFSRGSKSELWLLTGTLVCGSCGHGMNGHHHAQGRRYRCVEGPGRPGCGGVSVVAEPVEELLWNAALNRSWDAKAQAAVEIESKVSAVRAELRTTQSRLTELDDSYWQAADPIPRSTYDRQAEALRDKLQTLEAEIDLLRSEKVAADEWTSAVQAARFHEEATTAQRRAILARLLDRVEVSKAKPARWFDPDRLTVCWSEDESQRGSELVIDDKQEWMVVAHTG